MRVLIFSMTFFEKFLILRRIQGDRVNKHKCSYEVSIVIFVFNKVLIFATYLRKILKFCENLLSMSRNFACGWIVERAGES
jgi:hypothetical protein